MFLYLGATPNLPNIFLKLIESALICVIEELLKKIISETNNSKEWMLMFCFIPVILLGTAGRLS